MTRTTPEILKEVNYIVVRAAAGESRVVGLGPVVFFSSLSGDAWVLDPDDGRALCLARQGVPEPVNITETETQFAIEWTSSYRIEGDTMTFQYDSGEVLSIEGYPTTAILDAIHIGTLK